MVIRTVLIDLSGTLHIENTVTQGAVVALQRLRTAALKIKFVTNTTKESRRHLFQRLILLGFELNENEIFTSLHAARALIDRKSCKRSLLLLEPAALEDFEGVTQPAAGQVADAVVVGLSPSQFCYPVLNAAFRHLLAGASLIAIHQARYFKEPDGLSLGPGGFVKALEYAAGSQAQVVGKPTPDFFLAALDGSLPEEAVMIGDDARDDISGAQECGVRGILVRTGKYRPGDEIAITPAPFAVCDNFAEAVRKIIDDLNEAGQ